MRKKILLIEDEQDLAELMRARIHASDYEVQVAYDGEEALEKLGQQVPDLIILDISIPKIDGLTLFKKIRTHEPWRQIPVIVSSGKIVLYRTMMDEGAVEFLPKPFQPQVLMEMILKHT